MEGSAIFELMCPARLSFKKKGPVISSADAAEPRISDKTKKQDSALTVHVWTPEGSESQRPVPHPIINRYITAVDSAVLFQQGMPHSNFIRICI